MLQQVSLQLRRASLLTKALVLVGVGFVPVVMQSVAMAAPALTERELQSTSAIPSGTTDLTWIFDTPDIGGTNVDQIEIEFCDSPLSTCTNVVGSDNTGTDNIPILPASPTATLSGSWTSTGNTASRVDGRQAATASSANQITIDKTTADDTNNKDELQITVSGFTNDETANRTYYTRMRMYSDAGTTLVYEGVFAQSTSRTLTVNARVQERLDFCVGSTAVDDATSAVPTDCSTVTGNSVDVGNIENGNVNVSPVDPLNGGSSENGLAMIRTNAVNGATVSYRSLQNSASGSLKVPGATCGSTAAYPTGSLTDQCFNSADNTQIVAGEEEFGMTIGGVNCSSTTAYTCSFSGGTYNLLRDAKYDGTGTNTFVADNDLVAGTTSANYAWLDTGLADLIASSTGSTVKVIDDEALILKFAATAGVTTPTGSYTVQSDFIATATF